MRRLAVLVPLVASCSANSSQPAQRIDSAEKEGAVAAAPRAPADELGSRDDRLADPSAPGDKGGDRTRALEAARGAGVLGTTGAGAPGYAPRQAVASVKAGEWDDNANYRDFLKWIATAPRSASRLDVRDRQFLVVRDRDGKAVPDCTIDVATRDQGASTRLVTMASGRALLFPHVAGMAGEPLTATAACLGATATASFDPAAADGVVDLRLDRGRDLPGRRAIDVAFVLDTTGSMGEEIDAVKATIRTVSSTLADAQTDIRVGLVEYKDKNDDFTTKVFPFSSDFAQFSRRIEAISAGGGGDTPEDMHAGIAAALAELDWRRSAVARLVVVIADAPPHLDYQDVDYAASARAAASRGIKIFTVSASGMDDTGQVVMRHLAQLTGGASLFVLRGGAGPQSVGGGDPASSCGGTHQNYASGKLDELIVAKVKGELAALDADPMAIPGKGQDENAKPCDQRIVIAKGG